MAGDYCLRKRFTSERIADRFVGQFDFDNSKASVQLVVREDRDVNHSVTRDVAEPIICVREPG